MRALAASAIFCAASVGPAFADSSGTHDWSGPYIGADIGYAWGETGNTWRSPAAGFDDWQPDGKMTYGSATGGGYMGYLAQFGTIVLGAEIDVNAVSLKGDDAQTAGELNAIEMNYVGTIRGRLGYAFDSSLFYVTGGFAYGDYKKLDETVGWSKSDNLTGWTLGGGYEYALTNHWRARAEYQYVDFGSVNSLLLGPLSSGGDGFYFHRASDVNIQSVRAGLTYGF